jgi:hypothetical protein
VFCERRRIDKSKDMELNKTKLRIFNTNVKSVILYARETWRVLKTGMNKLQLCK